MRHNGLERVTVDRISFRPSMLSQRNELHLLSIRDVSPDLLPKVPGPSGMNEELRVSPLLSPIHFPFG